MKSRTWKISIFILMFSILSCGLLLIPQHSGNVYAAETQKCYNLLVDEDNSYLSNIEVGIVEGIGNFVVGASNVVLSATARDSYTLVGWKVTYNEQKITGQDAGGNDIIEKVEDGEDVSLLTLRQKYYKLTDTIELTDLDGQVIPVTLSSTEQNGYVKSGEFKISNVFEKLTVTPVFDHIYYQVDVSNMINLVSLNKINGKVDGNNLYYKEQVGDCYVDAILKLGTKFYYFGDLYEKGGKFYTKHLRQDDTNTEEFVEYTKGAFRINEQVNIAYGVNTDEALIKDDVNIVLQGVSVSSKNTVELVEFDSTNPTSYYKHNLDSYLRTIDFEIQFNVEQATDHKIVLNYHNLYFVDVEVYVDGSPAGSKKSEVLGDITNENNEFKSNVSITNYYSCVDESKLQFLTKQAQYNSSLAFGVVCNDSVTKVDGDDTYTYYNFDSLDGQKTASRYYAEIDQNKNIVVNYLTVGYEVKFSTLEYVKDLGEDFSLAPFDGNALDIVTLRRGEGIYLDANSVQTVFNSGYEFVGFSTDRVTMSDNVSYSIDEIAPKGTTIYLCFEKKDFEIKVSGLNTADKIGGSFAINSLKFAIANLKSVKPEEYEYQNTHHDEDANYTLTLTKTVKYGGEFSFVSKINNGFNVYFGLTSGATEATNQTSYQINADFVNDYTLSHEDYVYDVNNWQRDYKKLYIFDAGNYILNTSSDYNPSIPYFVRTNKDDIIIYANEETCKYTLTYIINPTEDSKLDEELIMATIDAEIDVAVKNYDLVKYAVEKVDGNLVYTEISSANGNTGAMVAKIEITKLRYNDKLILKSKGLSKGTGAEAYTYMFNWFTEDNKSMLEPVNEDAGEYSYEATMTKDRTITVVYSMPSTYVTFAIDEEFAQNKNFSFDIIVKNFDTGEVLSQNVNGFYNVEVGNILDVEILNLSEGYAFVGYQKEGNPLQKLSQLTFEYPVNGSGNHIVVLKFKQIQYRFDFYEYGGGRNGKTHSATLNIDNATWEIEKPIGYYVAIVKFKTALGDGFVDTYSTDLSENNNYRNNADISTYVLNISREKFIDITSRCARVEKDDYGEDVFVVDVSIDYLLFTYNISVIYVINGGVGDQSNIQFPEVQMTYKFNSEDVTINKTHQSSKVDFANVPYGSVDARISVLSGAPIGLEFAGWYVGENMISQENYIHSSHYIHLGNIVKDLGFDYKLSYISYYVNVNYDSNQGSPEVFVNNAKQIGTNNIQITLDDKLEIKAMPLKVKGYKFSKITYKVPKYVPCSVTEENWAELKDTLYVKKGGSFVKNTVETFDAEEEYFLYKYDEITYSDSENLAVTFDVRNYYVEGVKIYFTVEYELMKFTLSNSINSIENLIYGAIQKGILSAGEGAGAIQFKVLDLISFEVYAKDINGIKREIGAEDTITFKDEITVYAQINQHAINLVDNKEYDLSLGLDVSQVYVNNTLISTWKNNGNGLFLIVFNIEQFKPTEEAVTVKYDLRIQTRTISVTTIVTGSQQFYQNVKMVVNAEMFGFASGSVRFDKPSNSEPYVVLKAGGLQFLAMAKISSQLSAEYQKYFFISGVMIYCDGVEVEKDERALNGIAVDENTWMVDSRLFKNVHVVYKIQPIISYNGGPNFEMDFVCDKEGNAVEQQLSIGDTSKEIVVADMLAQFVKISYKSTALNSVEQSSVSLSGKYDVIIRFEKTEGYDWIEDIVIDDKITLTVKRKQIVLTYNEEAVNAGKIEKVYDGSSGFDVGNLYDYLIFTDNNGWSVKYSDMLLKSGNVLKLDQSMSAYISSNGKDERTSQANENDYYNIYVYNVALRPISFNENFILNTQDLIIKDYIKIKKRELALSGVSVYNKVYDETLNAELKDYENIVILNKVSGDDVVLNASKLSVQFENAEVGTNKKVLVLASSALGGEDVNNYKIADVEVQGLTIYPYEIKAEVKGFGEVSLINKRGLEEKDMVSLIPLNATFVVEPIYAESSEYKAIHSSVSKHLRGNKEFAIGYKLSMLVNGQKINIDKNLYLSIPSVKNTTGVFFLTGTQTGSLNHTNVDGKVEIDLAQLNVDVDTFFVVQRKLLLEVWQIVLIVAMSVLTISAVVLTIVIIRKRKLKEYKVHDKI